LLNHVSSWGGARPEKVRNYRRYVEEGLLSDNNVDLLPSEISNIIGAESFKDIIDAVKIYFNLDSENRIIHRKGAEPKCRKINYLNATFLILFNLLHIIYY
jgi:hypothetical protein